MKRFYSSVMLPDRHPSGLFLLALASAAGSGIGIFLLPGSGFSVSSLLGAEIPMTGIYLVCTFFLFLCGFLRGGTIGAPVLLLCFSAFAAQQSDALAASGMTISFQNAVFLGRLFLLYLSFFYLSTQAWIASRTFSAGSSRHIHRASPQRTFYIAEFLIVSILAAGACEVLGTL